MQCPMKTSGGNETLIAYGARTMTPEAELAFVRHMSACASCLEMAEQQRALWGALDQWQPLPISPDFDRRLYARIAEDQPRGFISWNWSWRPAMPVAAACTAVIAAFLMRGPILERQSAPTVQHGKVDIEQVERALDDIDMLKQLGVGATPASASSGAGS